MKIPPSAMTVMAVDLPPFARPELMSSLTSAADAMTGGAVEFSAGMMVGTSSDTVGERSYHIRSTITRPSWPGKSPDRARSEPRSGARAGRVGARGDGEQIRGGARRGGVGAPHGAQGAVQFDAGRR